MKVVLVSLSSKNVHKMPAAWKIKAYCDERSERVEIVEGNVNEKVRDVLERVLNASPDVVGFSCYIWNIEYVKKLAADLKALQKDVVIVLGGPEVSFENDISFFPFACHIIKGAGEEAFCELVKKIRCGEKCEELIEGTIGDFESYPNFLTQRYFDSFLNEQIPRIEDRLVYYESALGCPFACSYCLSSAGSFMQELSLKRVFSDIELLVQKGAKVVKFTDRTFNCKQARCKELFLFLKTLETECVFHFEAAADLFSEELLLVIKELPPGRVQFEIGIQSINDKTLLAVNRKTDIAKSLANIKRLVDFNNCHIHTDLIAGLPFETMESFAGGVNAVLNTGTHCLQLGFLKKLKGSKYAVDKHSAVFSDYPPYEVLCSDSLDFAEISHLKAIETLIDKFYNSKAFAKSLSYAAQLFGRDWFSLFEAIYNFSGTKNFRLNLKNSYTFMYEFLASIIEAKTAKELVRADCLTIDYKAMPDILKR